ncbi:MULTISPECIES: DUF2971 domain-containing protein [Rhodococcus]|uniref:DUF2971 domain-containing protein n=1 Tax=Rhodococcus TaxID=1827 RepID=UPI0004C3DF49|nr:MULTISPECIES: DUF2971 domain-containing protein [Rhodococcus]MCJ0897572.1 DUF2971 domain-containing protein [Rhodococcus sp. ARC_M13]OFE10626.1 hypothetical protein A5N83_01615 [Rhodococcus sp. 1139]BBE47429.1 hypothetical protein RE2895_43600 [Rhodococcus erythropolis]
MTTPEPAPLYHYTDSAGLLGILGNPMAFPGVEKNTLSKFTSETRFGVMWATDARYLNDSEEIEFGIPILAESLDAQADTADRTPAVADRLRELASDVREKRFDMTSHKNAGKETPYVACFCESPDLLSQWRGYGDGGGGYAIGFRREALPKFCEVHPSLILTYPHLALTQLYEAPHDVKYGAMEATKFMKECAQETADDLELVAAGKKTLTWPDTFRSVCATWLTRVKHQAFKEEAERRFIVSDSAKSGCEFRAGQIGLIPYKKLHFPITYEGKPTVSEIVIGPGSHRELRKKSVQRLLRQIGSPDTEVRLSDAPFRG